MLFSNVGGRLRLSGLASRNAVVALDDRLPFVYLSEVRKEDRFGIEEKLDDGFQMTMVGEPIRHGSRSPLSASGIGAADIAVAWFAALWKRGLL